jgi:hypothetical protein
VHDFHLECDRAKSNMRDRAKEQQTKWSGSITDNQANHMSQGCRQLMSRQSRHASGRPYLHVQHHNYPLPRLPCHREDGAKTPETSLRTTHMQVARTRRPRGLNLYAHTWPPIQGRCHSFLPARRTSSQREAPMDP